MITSSFSALRKPVSQCAQNPVPSLQNPYFAGKTHKKEAKDTVSIQKQASGKSSSAQNPMTLKKAMLTVLLLSGGNLASASPVGASKDVVTGHSSGCFDPFSFALPANPVHVKARGSENEKQAGKKHHSRQLGSVSADASSHMAYNDTINALVPGLTDDQATEMLKRPAFKPTVNSIFNNATYSDTMAPLSSKPMLTDDEVKTLLQTIMDKRFGKNTDQAKKGMELFDNAQLKAVVPSAILRGAIINLMGTIGEPAIEAYMDGTFGSAYFADLDPSMIAHSITLANETKPRIEFNKRYENEDPRRWSSTVAHEPLHQDLYDSVREELLAHALDSLIYGQIITEDPDVNDPITEFSQRLNTKWLARENSRKDGKMRLFESDGNVYPGGKISLDNFGAAFSNTGMDGPGFNTKDTTAGNNVFRAILEKATGVKNDTADFDQASEDLLDRNQFPLTPIDRIAAAKVHKLDTGDIPKGGPTPTASGMPSSSAAASSSASSTASGSAQPSHHTQTSDARRSHKLLWWDV